MVASTAVIEPTCSTEGNFEFVSGPIPVVSLHDHMTSQACMLLLSLKIRLFLVQPGEPAQGLNISSSGQLIIKPVQPSKSINTIADWALTIRCLPCLSEARDCFGIASFSLIFVAVLN